MKESQRLDSTFTRIGGITIGTLISFFSVFLMILIDNSDGYYFFGVMFAIAFPLTLLYLNAARITITNKTLTVKTLLKKERKYHSKDVCIKRFYGQACRMRLSDTESVFYFAHLREFITWDYESVVKEKYGIDSCE